MAREFNSYRISQAPPLPNTTSKDPQTAFDATCSCRPMERLIRPRQCFMRKVKFDSDPAPCNLTWTVRDPESRLFHRPRSPACAR